jgi:signal transduction histidine kinase/ActR/RegA family two-component response regulator
MGSNLKRELNFGETSFLERPLSILLVEDNAGDVVLIREMLNLSGIDFSLRHVSTLKETIILCGEHNFDVVLLDLGLSDSNGLETLKKIQVFNVKSPVVIMTGLDDEDVALEALRQGAQDYLVKNRLTSDNLLRGIKYGIERKKIQDLLKKTARQFSLLSSATTSINECEDISLIFGAACRNLSILIDNSGVIAVESGKSGKFYFAGIERFEYFFDRIKKITGLNIKGPAEESGFLKNEITELFCDGKLHQMSTDAYYPENKGTGGSVSTRQEESHDFYAYAIGFIRAERIYGGALIFTRHKPGVDDISIIETISNQVSLSLNRKIIEADLINSESRYRKLSQELEMKVRDRTRDLEASNYQLNRELTERHLAEEALKKSETQLREMNSTKDKFFNIIAHDLKNPFTSLLGSSELLNENIHEMDNEMIKHLAQILNDSAKSGYAILQNLLDWSRSQTGMIKFSPEEIDLKTIIDENISDIELLSVRKDIKILNTLENNMLIYADKNMVNTILRNLLSNAVKFTHSGGTVTVSVSDEINEAIISVRDNGTGISEENIGELFRIDSKYTRPGTAKEQGTGLGLKLTKEFVEMQGGRIWVKSEINKGSEFLFSIPLK